MLYIIKTLDLRKYEKSIGLNLKGRKIDLNETLSAYRNQISTNGKKRNYNKGLLQPSHGLNKPLL